jgi:membrane protein YqaA with SNARE-associated domain
MRNYSPGKGRRRAVEKFTNRQGLWILVILGVTMVGILMLILSGYLNADMD